MNPNQHYQLTFNKTKTWVNKTFPDTTAEVKWLKCSQELIELRNSFVAGESRGKQAFEIADVLITLVALADKLGFSAEDVLTAWKVKMDINMERKWIKNEDGTYSHTR